MPSEAWLTLAVVAATVVVLARDYLPPSGAMVGAMVAVMAFGIVTPAEALNGFSNTAPATIAGLYVVAKAVEKTGFLTPLVRRMLGEQGSIRSSLTRLVIPATGASAVLNNTPIVAMLIPQVESWSLRRGWPASRFLMPLSFAAILGGSVTLIGTATNLVVSGLLESDGYDAIGFFEISKLGLPVALIGGIAIVALAPMLLPMRSSPREDLEEADLKYTIEYTIDANGPLDGKSVTEASLRNLHGVYLAQILRGSELLSPVSPETRLRGGDRLLFVGAPTEVVELTSMAGLRLSEDTQVERLGTGRTSYYEVVVGTGGGIAGQTLRELEFRSRYQAAVLAIHRAGSRVEGQLGRIPIRVGDSLLVASDSSFGRRWTDRHDFLLVSPLNVETTDRRHAARVVGVILAIVAMSLFLDLALITAVLLAALGMVLAQVLSPTEARQAVNLDVIIAIAAAFGLAAAIAASGLADAVAARTVDLFEPLGTAGVLLGIVLATTVLKELVTTNAAALLMFPIAITSALAVGADPRGYAIAVAVAASKSFLTPIGYQTNTMVYGPGGYRYFDYMRLGIPLTVIVMTLIIVIVPIAWPS